MVGRGASFRPDRMADTVVRGQRRGQAIEARSGDTLPIIIPTMYRHRGSGPLRRRERPDEVSGRDRWTADVT
jgi:hypothetical protein